MPSDKLRVRKLDDDRLTVMTTQEVISYRNQLKAEANQNYQEAMEIEAHIEYLTKRINKVQKPVAKSLKGNSNSSKSINE